MKSLKNQVDLPRELRDEDLHHTRAAFHERLVPKLIKLDARIGTLSCEFAGKQYKNWTIQFRSVGSDFEIVDFEYDEGAGNIDLDL